MENDLRIMFVFGCPRSGTTFLSRLLACHPEIGYLEEPATGRRIRKMYLDGLKLFRLKKKMTKKECSEYLEGESYSEKFTLSPEEIYGVQSENFEAIREYFTSFFTKFLEENGKSILLEKTPENAIFLKFLSIVFPNARFVHVIRDGRDVMGSFIQREFVESWDLAVSEEEAMDALSVRQDGARFWRAYIESVQAFEAYRGSPCERVFYEEYVNDPKKIVENLLKPYGLRWTSEMDVFLKQGMDGGLQVSRMGKFREILSSEQIQGFERVNHDLLRSFGYEIQTDVKEVEIHGS